MPLSSRGFLISLVRQSSSGLGARATAKTRGSGRPRDGLNAWLSRRGACRLHSKNALPDLKVRRLGWPRGGPMVLALIFRFLFIKEKEGRMSISVGDGGASPPWQQRVMTNNTGTPKTDRVGCAGHGQHKRTTRQFFHILACSASASISILLKANHFFPKSFSEAPTW